MVHALSGDATDDASREGGLWQRLTLLVQIFSSTAATYPKANPIYSTQLIPHLVQSNGTCSERLPRESAAANGGQVRQRDGWRTGAGEM